jgi:triosephosphate isomerase (TIM)
VRRSYIAGNWKMHKTVGEARELASDLDAAVGKSEHKLMVAPPFTALAAVADTLKDSSILVGAQNMAVAESGAHTGEVSVLMLKDIGVATVILGHSERRHVYGESDDLINEKVKLGLKHGLEIILCVGEKIDEREAGSAVEVVERQLTSGLADVSEESLSSVTIAYEPVWAIGTGKTATPDDADAMHAAIRKVLAGLFSESSAQSMIIQYGGSVKPGNANSLLTMENIDGALVGGAALDCENFVPIVEYLKN